jgi:hypothetical protein
MSRILGKFTADLDSLAAAVERSAGAGVTGGVNRTWVVVHAQRDENLEQACERGRAEHPWIHELTNYQRRRLVMVVVMRTSTPPAAPEPAASVQA